MTEQAPVTPQSPRPAKGLRFSVVSATLNAEATIGQAIESLLGQVTKSGSPYLNFEFIVADGGSIDRTVAVAEAYRARFDDAGIALTVLSEPDTGAFDGMNRGLVQAKGEYTLFLNDDTLEPRALSYLEAAAAASADRRPEFVAAPAFNLALPEKPDGPQKAAPLPKEISAQHPGNLPACHQATAVRTEFARELGGFDTRYPIAADYELFLRAHAEGARWVLAPEPVACFRGGGISSDYSALIREYRAAQLEHGQPRLTVEARFVRHLVMDVLQRLGLRKLARR